MYSETSPAATTRASQKQASRIALLQSAMRLISTGGIVAVTHRAVAAEAGVSPALVTYHFGDIAGLLVATREHAISVGAGKLDTVIAKVRSGDMALIDATTAYLSNVIENRTEEFRVTLEFDLAATRPGTALPAHLHDRETYIALIRPFVASDTVARRVFSAIFGYAFQGMLGLHSGAPSDCAAFLADLFQRYDVANLPIIEEP